MLLGFQKRNILRFIKKSWITFIFLISFATIIGIISVNSFESISNSISKTTSSVGALISAPFNFIQKEKDRFKSLKSIKKENEKLIQQIADLQFQIQTLKTIELENENLKKQLGIFKEIKFNKKTAKILFDKQDAYFKTILIDLGKNDNIKEGQPVLANGFLLGQIIEVFEDTSRVLLVNDSNFKTDVVIPRINIRGFIRGNNYDNANLYNMEKKDGFSKGDLVVTNGMNQNIPSNLLIGTLVSKSGKISLFADIKNTDYVTVIISTIRSK